MTKINTFNYQTPPIKELLERKYSLVDMHTHTTFSDGKNTATEMLLEARKQNIWIAFTDHFDIKAPLALYNNSYGVKVIPGVEITIDEEKRRHACCYFRSPDDLENFFYDFCLNNNKDQLADIVHEHGGIISLAHPFGWEPFHKTYNHESNWRKNLQSYDSMEIINGHNHLYQAYKAYLLANIFNKGFTGGSDAHQVERLGDVLTITKAKTIDGLFNAIIKKETYVIGKNRDYLSDPVKAFKELLEIYIKNQKKRYKTEKSENQ